MAKFRCHRVGLAESMETVVEFDGSKEALMAVLETTALPFPSLDLSQIDVEYYGHDERIGWDTYIVTVKENAVGFTDCPVGV